MPTPLHNANGHRRRDGPRCSGRDCTGCIPHEMRGEVDEDIPRARGGSPYDRRNTHLLHRKCNRWKGTMTLSEARTKLRGESHTSTQPTIASPIW